MKLQGSIVWMAMGAGITDHWWSVGDLLAYQNSAATLAATAPTRTAIQTDAAPHESTTTVGAPTRTQRRL